ncbi:hypothetical protein Q3G72_020491 [Acer saccharum]|nr:hypothetical protein Q3G72_020491 [Acer saccharum]
MASSSRKLAATVSSIASFIYFFLIIFQIPLFRVPCRIGICKTPIEMTCSQMIASEIFPVFVVKALLYPGAFAKSVMQSTPLPSYTKLLKFYNFTNVKKSPAYDLHRLEILAGSYLSVAGAVVGLIRAGRMSLFGTLLIVWGFVKEVIFRKQGYLTSTKTTYMYPAMSLAVLCAFLSIRRDVRKIIRCYKSSRSVTKSLRSKAKHV